jgi:RND family efflux transporter MFP subunit
MVVTQGQILAILDDSVNLAQLALAQSQVAAAQASIAEFDVQIRQAQLDLERTQGLAQRNLAVQADLDRDELSVEAMIARLNRSKRDIDVAERTVTIQKRLLADMEIRAPFGGVVIAKAAQPGEMISPIAAGGGFTNTGICTIVDMDSLEVEVDVNESYINRVYPKQPVNVTLNAYPAVKMPAEVIAIIPAADRNKATVRVRIGFMGRDERVMPEMGAKVAFLDEDALDEPDSDAPPAVLIPRSSVGDDGGDRFVWVVEDDRVNRRSVVVGAKEGQRLRVVSGLRTGERVVAGLDEELLASLEDGALVSVVN